MKYIEIHVKHALSKSKLKNTDYALNPYRGCEHRCVYCYAPYVLHIPLEEWNSTVYVKRNLPTVLDKELRRKKGHVEVGTVTDAYQPAERRYEITRMSLEVLKKHNANISVLTKSSLILRDKDILENMNAEIGVTITTPVDALRKKIEPYASPVDERMQVLEEFAGRNITYAFIGPIFPRLLIPYLKELLTLLRKIGVDYVIFDRFRMKKGMHVPDFLMYGEDDLKIKINRIAKNSGLKYYFGW